jgi:putative aldouronate transport system permease protein
MKIIKKYRKEDGLGAIKSKSRFCIDNMQFLIMCMPCLIWMLIFMYIPMGGLALAFKNYNVNLGLMGSPWVGFKNFEFFLTSNDAWRITRNTLSLNIMFIFTNLFISVGIALMLFEVKKREALKFYNTSMILPSFVSWVIAGYMLYALLNPTQGIINKSLGLNITWYQSNNYWPSILGISYNWKVMGVNCLIYYATLIGVDSELFEAAELDGANKLQKIWHISIPSIVPVIIIMTLLAIGNIFRSDFGMFYNLTRDVGILYKTTDVIDTYIYRVLRSLGDVGISTAVGFYQSVVGFILITLSNFIVKKIEPESSLF